MVSHSAGQSRSDSTADNREPELQWASGRFWKPGQRAVWSVG